MKKENVPLDVPTIRAAVAGEAWAVEKVIEHYSNKEEKQSNGSIKKIVDGDMRQALISKLIDSLPQFAV